MLTTAATAETSTLQIIRVKLRQFCRGNYQIMISFGIPFLILLIAYMCMGVYPISNGSVLSLDLNGQYVYYYDYMYDVLAGKESIAYSWSRNLSGEFMGIVGYYLASPFNLLVWMFPREHITEGLLTMMITKVGAIGACCAVYLSRGKKYDSFTVIIFSSLYALCAYTVEQTMNPMWLDGVLALPIVVYGIEKLIDENKFRMLVAAWVYSFVTCFYIGYMIGIFSAVYFIYYCCATGNRQVFSKLFRKAGLFALSALTAVMISAFMILPVYSSLSLGKFEFSEPDYSLKANFNLIELAGKMLPDSYDTVRMSGLPFLYCGTLCLLLVPAYFFLNKLPIRERAAGASITAFMFVCMYICPVDMMWHGGQLPNWLPQRYSFMISFLFICFAAKAFNSIEQIRGRTIGVISAAWFMLILYLENLDTFDATLGSEGRDWLDGITVILPALLLLLIATAVLCAYRTKFRKSFSAKIPIIVFICAELIFNTTLQCVKQNIDIVYSSRDSYNNVILPTREVVQEIKENDDGFYRIEKNFFRTVNDPLALNMYGLSHSSSTLNAKPIALLEKLGFTARSHYTRFSGQTPLTSDLFGVKYILSTETNSTADIKSADDITYEVNENCMPVAYLVDEGILDCELKSGDPFRSQNMLLSAMLGDEDTNIYFKRIYEVDMTSENVKQGTTTDGHHSFKVEHSGKNAQLEYTIRMTENATLYMYLPTKYERQLNVWIDKEWAGNYFEGDNYHIKNLGDYKSGDTMDLILTLTKDDLYFKEAQFAYLDNGLLNRDIERLHEMNSETEVEALSTTHFKITVNSDEDRVLFTTIPSEPGWKITVDGVETEASEALEALIAVPVTAGRHVVEMTFTTAGYPVAWFITIGGIIIFAAMIVVYLKVRKVKAAVKTAENAENSSKDVSEADEESIDDFSDAEETE